MTNSDEETKVDLRQFKRYQKKFPWGIVIKVIVAMAILGGIVFFIDHVPSKEVEEDHRQDFEIEIEL